MPMDRAVGESELCRGRRYPQRPDQRNPPAGHLGDQEGACNRGQQKLIDPETFRDFYTCWKETEAQAQEVSLPAAVTEHLDKNECVYKLSGSVKTSRGVGKIAMTQKRLFLLTEGRPGYCPPGFARLPPGVRARGAPLNVNAEHEAEG
ncbi:DENN domain-containing protein 3 [Myotis brandtii]|uniref:DENN domain-containing protein 3 n=1 Tax=Myotis brandtii TaxID=109478 RepID=S7NEN4_MYOBR|nr:DENN domain-containing protein 3 [Myotis brandtii]